MKNSGKQEFEELIRPIKIACTIFGSWPSGDDDDEEDEDSLGALKRHGFHLFAFVLMATTLIGSTTESVKLWGEDMNETIECSLVSSAFYMAVIRVAVFWIYEKDFKFVIRMMRRDWIESSEKERSYLRNKCLLTFKFAKLFVMNVLMVGSTFVIMPLIDMVGSILTDIIFLGRHIGIMKILPGFSALFGHKSWKSNFFYLQ